MESVRVRKGSGSVLSMFLKLGTSFRKANDVRNDVLIIQKINLWITL
jgi:hypothetical protein